MSLLMYPTSSAIAFIVVFTLMLTGVVYKVEALVGELPSVV